MTWIYIKHKGKRVGQVEYVFGKMHQASISDVEFVKTLAESEQIDLDVEDVRFQAYLAEEEKEQILESWEVND